MPSLDVSARIECEVTAALRAPRMAVRGADRAVALDVAYAIAYVPANVTIVPIVFMAMMRSSMGD